MRFNDIQLALQQPPTPGLPDPTSCFTQIVVDRGGCMTSVPQEHGRKLRSVAYFSAQLDPVAARLPHCL